MKRAKLILLILLIITMCCPKVITPFTVSAYSNIDSCPDFDVDVYVAGLMSDDENPLCRTIKNQIALDSPNDVVINQLKSDMEFQASYAAWQIATFKGGDTVSDSHTEVGYYQSLILSTIHAALTSSCVKDSFGNAIVRDSKHLLSAFTNILKTEFVFTDLNDLNIAEMSQGEQIKVMDAFSSSFKKTYPGVSDVNKFVGIFSTIVKEGEALEGAINNLTAYTESVNMNDYMKAVVSDLYENCDSSNVAMKLALFEINTACQSYELAYTAATFDAASSSLSVVCEKVVNTMFDGIMAANPAGLSIMIGQAIGKSIANLLFSTDAICEQYHKMCCLYEFEELLGKVTKLEISRFSNSKTTINANKIFSSIDFLYKEYDVSCDLAKKYADIIFKESKAGIFILNNDGYNNYISSVESLRFSAISNYNFLKGDAWTYFLEEDYPDIYEALIKEEDEIKNPYIPVTDIKFEKDSVEWGTDDAFLNYDKATIIPSFASAPSIEYTSSDNSVVSYNKFGAVVHKAGTAIITATSVSSGVTAILNVTVVDGKGADGIAIEDPGTNEQISKGETFTVGNNSYEIVSESTVGVVSGAPNANGIVIIPETVCYKNNLFCVTQVIDGSMKGAGAAKGAFTNGGSYSSRNTSVEKIVLPNTITYIGRYAFCYCKNLKSVEIPEGVVSLGFSLFDYSGVKSVTIPQSLQSLGGCGASGSTYHNNGFLVRDVYYYGSQDNWNNLTDASGDYYGLKNVAKVHILHTHRYSSFVTKEPTYTETGERTFTCICGDSYIEIINMLPTEPSEDPQPNPSVSDSPDSTESPKPTGSPNENVDPKPTNNTTESPEPTDEPDATASPKPTNGLDVAATPKPTDKPDVTTSPRPTNIPSIVESPMVGTILKDPKSGTSYRVLEQGKSVVFNSPTNEKIKKAVIPDSVTLSGIDYRVTEISDNAFIGCKKLRSVTIGKYVTRIGNKAFFKCVALKKIMIPSSVLKIGKKAFYGCKKLNLITFKTKKLKGKSVGTQAFKGIHKRAVLKVPKKQKKAYKKWLKKKGIAKTVKIK